jgi:hypothetical protein
MYINGGGESLEVSAVAVESSSMPTYGGKRFNVDQ